MLHAVIRCSNWSSCTANSRNFNCSYYDMFTEALQYPSWSSFNDFNLTQQRYGEATDALTHLCTSIYPGMMLTQYFDVAYWNNDSCTPKAYHNCDSTTMRLRYYDAFDYDGSDRNYDLCSIRLRYDYGENWDVHCLFASNCVEWKKAHAIRRSRIVVGS